MSETTESGWMTLGSFRATRVGKQGHGGYRLYATGTCPDCLHGPCRCEEIKHPHPVTTRRAP